MYSEQRGIFKPSLKTHSMTDDLSIKRFSFAQQLRKQDQRKFIQETSMNEAFSYPSLDENFASIENQFSNGFTQQREKEIKYPSLVGQTEYELTATKFDPILPKILFKRFISNEETPINQAKKANSQILQQLKVKNINYPLEVEKLTKQAEQKKIQYFIKAQSNQSSQKNQTHENQWRQNSYRNSINQHSNKGLKKMPYFPLMGTDGKIFWSHSADKVVLWKYRNSQLYNPDVFCILSFQQQSAPISAIYATHVISPLFKNQRIIFIAIAFFNQLQFFSFNIEKYETEFSSFTCSNQKNEDFFKKYVEKILVKVNSNFFIEKILIQNIQNHADSNHQTRPLILFTDGSQDLEIVDLSNLSAFKSHNQYDFLLKKQKRKLNKNQNEIIKLLHCKDQISPEIHYAFVLRKQTVINELKPKTLIEKIKKIFTFTKKYEKSQQMILSIYEWNQKELKNQTLWKQFWNPPRIKKIKEISSKDLENRLKQNFFEFFKLNANSQFLIADISLVQKPRNYSIFQDEQKSSCFLKVTFINGMSVMISNFRTLTFVSKVKVNPYIERNIPILSSQYQNYRTILQKGHHLLSQQEIKNKFNLYIYEPVEIEKQAKYSFIDPVVSESNGLMICEDKLIYQDDEQIIYKFHESNSRKRINEINMEIMGEKKCFMIFENSFITLIETPNIAENLLILGYLLERYPQGKDKIRNYCKSLIEDMSQSSRISFLKSTMQLLISINGSGKTTKSSNSNSMIFNEIVRQFYGRQKRMDIDDTTYLENKDQKYKQISEEVYGYECVVGKQGYQNFVEYLLGSEIQNREKQYLKDRNNSYNGLSFQLKVTQKTVSFIQDILIDQSVIQITSKPIIKPVRSMSMDQFYDGFNMNEEGYLQNLIEGMSEVHESYLVGAFSKLVVDLIRPLINLPYESYHYIKSKTTHILENLDLLKQFIDKFIRYSTLKNLQSPLFAETLLLIKSLQNSLPKLSLLIKLFDSLSEVHFNNAPSLITSPKSNITLLNFLFKLDPKQILSQTTVEKLFEQNSLLLDEIQHKLPELNEIKYLRYFTGWKKINSIFLQNVQKENNAKKPIESGWIFSIFGQNKPQKAKKQLSNSVFPYQSESCNHSDNITREKQQFMEIQKALSEYSYEDFENFFVIKHQFVNFANIMLSKIYYLQINYLQLKNKYQFQDGSYDSFQSFHSHSHQQSAQNDIKARNHNVNHIQRNKQKPQLDSFLKYQQKVHNHQKYLKTYKLIQFLNSKLSLFIDKALDVYNQQTLKSSKNLLSTANSYNPKDSLLNHSTNQYRNVDIRDSHYILGQQIQNLIDLLMQKGSQFIKNQLENKAKLSPVLNTFMARNNQNLIHSSKEKQIVDFYDDKIYLVKDQSKAMTEIEKQQIWFENQRKNMYLQKMEQKITIDIGNQFKFQSDMNWMKNHNKNSALNLNNSYF